MKRLDDRIDPYRVVSVRRDQRLREIELTLWRVFGATLTGVAFAAWMAFLAF